MDEKKYFLQFCTVVPLSHQIPPNLNVSLKTLVPCIEIEKSENPYASFFTGDFNAHSQLWWPDGDTNPEGHELDELFSSLDLCEIINDPTNFTPNKRPSCIDLVVTDQPNIILDSGTRPFLDSLCHHNIIYCKINLHIPPPPPYDRKIWYYDRANVDALKRSISQFPWRQHLNLNPDPNW